MFDKCRKVFYNNIGLVEEKINLFNGSTGQVNIKTKTDDVHVIRKQTFSMSEIKRISFYGVMEGTLVITYNPGCLIIFERGFPIRRFESQSIVLRHYGISSRTTLLLKRLVDCTYKAHCLA